MVFDEAVCVGTEASETLYLYRLDYVGTTSLTRGSVEAYSRVWNGYFILVLLD
jgi:hypothetical protein